MDRGLGRCGSHVKSWVERSWTWALCTTPSPPPALSLERSDLLRFLRQIPRAYPVAIGFGLMVTATGLMTGISALVWMSGAFVAALCLPSAAVLSLPAVLIWTPRINLAAAADEALFVRLDQALVLGLLAYATLHPKGRLRTPPAHGFFLAFLAAVVASILIGLGRGTLATPVSALLYLGQWLEFYTLYVVAFSLRLDSPWPKALAVYAWALPLLALAAYGLAERAWPYYEVPDVRYRTFERVLFPGQANHAAGLFALATAAGLVMALRTRQRVLGLALALLSTLALIPTGSRSGGVAWLAGVGLVILIFVPALRWWAPPLAVLGLASVPAAFWQRVFAPGSSMFDRLLAWKSAMSTVNAYPLLGLGAGARHRSYYDNHYIMTLAESGLCGLLLLVLLLLCLGYALGHASRRSQEESWWCLAAVAGLGALAVHGLATATFIVTLVAGPFFWLCGVALGGTDRRP